MHRRVVLIAMVTTASLTLGGCVLDRDPVTSGTLLIDNYHDRAHTITVVVSNASGEDESTFEVAAGAHIRRPEFITEPGTFDVEVRTETGETAATRIDLYSAGPDGEQVGGGFVFVDIDDEGRLEAGIGHDD